MTDAYQAVIDSLSACKRVLVTTHVRPDGDALGSVAAMVMGMRKKGIEGHVLLLSHLPKKYAFIFQDNGIGFTDVEGGWPEGMLGEKGLGFGVLGVGGEEKKNNQEWSGSSSPPDLNPKPETPNPFSAFDALLVMDTGTWSQLPGVQERVATFTGKKIVVDHHLTQQDWADVKLVETSAAAAGEIATELLERWGVAMDQAIASALFLAIASDTGWFQFSNTKAHTLRMAADLIEAGVDTDRMYQLLYQNERAERVRLQIRAMQSLELLAGGKLAVMRIWKKDFEETGASVPDTENLINVPLQIAAVEVSILVVEPKDFGPVRVSLRSKGQVDVAKFAEGFGGGGHARAAGLKVDGAFDGAHDKVVAAMVARMGSQS